MIAHPRMLALAAVLLLAAPAAAQAPAVAPPATQTDPAPAAAPSTPAPNAAPPAAAAPSAPVDNAGPGPRIVSSAPDAPAPAAPVPAGAAPDAGAAPPAPASADPGPVDLDPAAPPEAAARAPVPAAATLPHDLTPYGMFMAADYIVKGVMIGLAFASLVTWTIWLAKAIELATSRAKAQRAVRRLEQADSLQAVVADGTGSKWPKRGPVAALVHAALREEERSADLTVEGIKERTQIALHRIEARAGRSMQRGTGLLATIGSTAPFVGLFGTVWGIMNAFIGISKANTTNLAVVAPGIAEALLATAIGLVAAIPAVIIYNVFARAIAGYRAVLADASAEVLRHLSRDLDRRELGGARKAAEGARASQPLAAE